LDHPFGAKFFKLMIIIFYANLLRKVNLEKIRVLNF
jgi:hypothetical protein